MVPSIILLRSSCISIHALLAESDGIVYPDGAGPSLFQSTLSLRRATTRYNRGNMFWAIFQSTLSLRRATAGCGGSRCCGGDFNPRSPCGERLSACCLVGPKPIFQSTLSLRRATSPHSCLPPCQIFQSTLSLRRATLRRTTHEHAAGNFNPRSPCGERHQAIAQSSANIVFQSTLSLRRATAPRIH